LHGLSYFVCNEIPNDGAHFLLASNEQVAAILVDYKLGFRDVGCRELGRRQRVE
jgi:hypothetical protein